MKIKFDNECRGFITGHFSDWNNEECSIQESSSATENLIWLGAGSERMHLSQAQVKALLPLLHSFVEKGDLRSAIPDVEKARDEYYRRVNLQQAIEELDMEELPDEMVKQLEEFVEKANSLPSND